jgi:hypothetical protein
MNSGLKEIEEEKQTLLRRPPQVKSSKAQIQAKFHKIPAIRFEDQRLTSFSGLLIFQALFTRMNLKQRLKKCFSHLKVSPIFGRLPRKMQQILRLNLLNCLLNITSINILLLLTSFVRLQSCKQLCTKWVNLFESKRVSFC